MLKIKVGLFSHTGNVGRNYKMQQKNNEEFVRGTPTKQGLLLI